jgi:hypothetical protein
MKPRHEKGTAAPTDGHKIDIARIGGFTGMALKTRILSVAITSPLSLMKSCAAKTAFGCAHC